MPQVEYPWIPDELKKLRRRQNPNKFPNPNEDRQEQPTIPAEDSGGVEIIPIIQPDDKEDGSMIKLNFKDK